MSGDRKGAEGKKLWSAIHAVTEQRWRTKDRPSRERTSTAHREGRGVVKEQRGLVSAAPGRNADQREREHPEPAAGPAAGPRHAKGRSYAKTSACRPAALFFSSSLGALWNLAPPSVALPVTTLLFLFTPVSTWVIFLPAFEPEQELETTITHRTQQIVWLNSHFKGLLDEFALSQAFFRIDVLTNKREAEIYISFVLMREGQIKLTWTLDVWIFSVLEVTWNWLWSHITDS